MYIFSEEFQENALDMFYCTKRRNVMVNGYWIVDEVKKLSHIYKASDNFQEQGIFTPPILKSTDCFLLHF
jgi:hypothetical protein